MSHELVGQFEWRIGDDRADAARRRHFLQEVDTRFRIGAAVVVYVGGDNIVAGGA